MDTTIVALAISLVALAVAVWALFLAAYPRIDRTASKRVLEIELELANQRDLSETAAKTLKKMAARQNMRARRDDEREERDDDLSDPMARRRGESGEAWKSRIGTLLMNRRAM